MQLFRDKRGHTLSGIRNTDIITRNTNIMIYKLQHSPLVDDDKVITTNPVYEDLYIVEPTDATGVGKNAR